MGFQEVQKLLQEYEVIMQPESTFVILTTSDDKKDAAQLLNKCKGIGVCACVYVPEIGVCNGI